MTEPRESWREIIADNLPGLFMGILCLLVLLLGLVILASLTVILVKFAWFA